MSTGINCSICLSPIELEDLCTTDCNHIFCKECLDKWFDTHKLSCPLCRSEIQYFNHKNMNHRIVCIIKKERATGPPNRTILITRRSFFVLNFIMGLSLVMCGVLSSMVRCDNSYEDSYNDSP